MPEKSTRKRAQQRRESGQAPSTQAGAFVREAMEQVKSGKTEVSSPKQAIAIGLSKARRAGIKVPDRRGRTSARKKTSATKKSAKKTTAKKATARSRRTTTRRAPTAKGKVSARTATAKPGRKKVAKKASTARSKRGRTSGRG